MIHYKGARYNDAVVELLSNDFVDIVLEAGWEHNYLKIRYLFCLIVGPRVEYIIDHLKIRNFFCLAVGPRVERVIL